MQQKRQNHTDTRKSLNKAEEAVFTAQTKANLEKAQEQVKAQANKHRSITPKYQIGNKVWLSTDNLKVTCASKKFME